MQNAVGQVFELVHDVLPNLSFAITLFSLWLYIGRAFYIVVSNVPLYIIIIP